MDHRDSIFINDEDDSILKDITVNFKDNYLPIETLNIDFVKNKIFKTSYIKKILRFASFNYRDENGVLTLLSEEKKNEIDWFKDFKISVSVYDTNMVIGVCKKNNEAKIDLEARVCIVSIYHIDNPLIVSEIVSENNLEKDYFGMSVLFYRDLVVIGSREEIKNDTLSYQSGRVFLYDVFDMMNPYLLSEITAKHGVEEEFFGSDLFIADDFLLIGTKYKPEKEKSPGKLCIYDITNKMYPERIGVDFYTGPITV